MANQAITVPFDIVVDTKSTDRSITKVAEMLENKIGGSIDKFIIKKFSDSTKEASLLVKSGDKFYQTMIKLNESGSIYKRGLKSKTSEDFKSTSYGDSFGLFGKIRTKADAKQFIKAANDNLKVEQAEAAAKDKKTDAQEKYNKAMQKYLDILNEGKHSGYSQFKNLGDLISGTKKQGVEIGIDTEKDPLTSSVQKKYDEQLAKFKEYAKEIPATLKGLIPAKEIAQIELDSLIPKLNSVKREIVDIASIKGDISEKAKEFNELNEQVKKLQKETSKGGIQKFLERFKAFATTRLFRNFFRFLEAGFNKGIQNLSQFDSNANETMSKLTSSMTNIFNSIAVAVVPLIQIITPIIEKLSNVIADIANYISQTTAKAKGLTTYTKVNAEYMKDFADSANAATLSFDKFESLNANDDNMFVEADVNEEISSGIKTELAEILTIISAIAAFKIVDKINEWTSGLKKLTNETKNVTGLSKALNGVSIALKSVALGVGAFLLADELFKKMPDWVKIVGLATSAITALAISCLAAAGAMSWGTAVPIITAAVGVGAAAIKNLVVEKKADGGMVDRGTLFVAGEAGPELVTSMPSGQTGVTNIAQFKQAMLEALYEWDGGGSSVGGDVVLNLDGAEVARSKRFVGEMNRRNSGLNLR